MGQGPIGSCPWRNVQISKRSVISTPRKCIDKHAAEYSETCPCHISVLFNNQKLIDSTELKESLRVRAYHFNEVTYFGARISCNRFQPFRILPSRITAVSLIPEVVGCEVFFASEGLGLESIEYLG